MNWNSPFFIMESNIKGFWRNEVSWRALVLQLYTSTKLNVMLLGNSWIKIIGLNHRSPVQKPSTTNPFLWHWPQINQNCMEFSYVIIPAQNAEDCIFANTFFLNRIKHWNVFSKILFKSYKTQFLLAGWKLIRVQSNKKKKTHQSWLWSMNTSSSPAPGWQETAVGSYTSPTRRSHCNLPYPSSSASPHPLPSPSARPAHWLIVPPYPWQSWLPRKKLRWTTSGHGGALAMGLPETRALGLASRKQAFELCNCSDLEQARGWSARNKDFLKRLWEDGTAPACKSRTLWQGQMRHLDLRRRRLVGKVGRVGLDVAVGGGCNGLGTTRDKGIWCLGSNASCRYAQALPHVEA